MRLATSKDSRRRVMELLPRGSLLVLFHAPDRPAEPGDKQRRGDHRNDGCRHFLGQHRPAMVDREREGESGRHMPVHGARLRRSSGEWFRDVPGPFQREAEHLIELHKHAGGVADLKPRSAGLRNVETCDDRRQKALTGFDAQSDAEGDCQRQCDDTLSPAPRSQIPGQVSPRGLAPRVELNRSESRDMHFRGESSPGSMISREYANGSFGRFPRRRSQARQGNWRA